MKQLTSLGAKSSDWNNVIPGSADSQPEALNRRVKSVKSGTAQLHFITVDIENELLIA